MGTKIEWTDETWNPVVGCSKVSEGCQNCYAERMANRLACMGQKKYQATTGILGYMRGWNGSISCDESALDKPLYWRKPRKIFVCSMGDLFHESVPFEFIDKVFFQISFCPQHRFQILTKRPERMAEYIEQRKGNNERKILYVGLTKFHRGKKFQWPFRNLWLGVTVEHPYYKHRIDTLRQIPAAVRFLSIEPCLADMGELNLRKGKKGKIFQCLKCGWKGNHTKLTGGNLSINCPKCNARNTLGSNHTNELKDIGCYPGIDQVIVGGESGPGARPMHPDWARGVRDQCVAAGVPFFFKQWGEWLPLGQHPSAKTATLINRNKRLYQLSSGFYGKPMLKGVMEHIDKDGTFPGNYVDEPIYRVGKKNAGRLLDGREWNEMPKKEYKD